MTTVLNKWCLALPMTLLIACVPEFSDVTLEVQMLKRYTKEGAYSISYGSSAGYKNSYTRNLPIYNEFEKRQTPVENRAIGFDNNFYISFVDDIDLKVTLYRNKIICGQYILRYKEGSLPSRSSSSSSIRQFLVSCPR